ncbi:MAG: response regulator [Chloroflexi bacterium]|nr:response regulator [Chloroflexota bacterium]
MVVDDDDVIRDLIVDALSYEGYVVNSAPNGAAALAVVHLRQPDLILLDLDMPIMNGREFALRYRELRGHHAPIVIVTAGLDSRRSAAEMGADYTLAKPFDIGDLLSVVARYVLTA